MDLMKLKTELVSLRTHQTSSAAQVKLARIRVRMLQHFYLPCLQCQVLIFFKIYPLLTSLDIKKIDK